MSRFFLAAAVLGAGTALAAEVIPSDPEGFTNYVAGAFKAALPDYQVNVAGRLTVGITRSGAKDGMQANLDRMFDFCARDARNCPQMLRQFIVQFAGAVKNANAPIDAAMLRLVVRPKAYIDGLHKQLGEARAAEMAVENLPGGLTAVCYLDFPTAARPAMAADFAKLGLTKEDALGKARENLAKVLGSLADGVKDLSGRSIGTLSGNYYESSWFALHEAWSEVSDRFGGELIVAVPAADIVLYARRTDRASVDALRSLAAGTARRSDRPISNAVFHWSKENWEPVEP